MHVRSDKHTHTHTHTHTSAHRNPHAEMTRKFQPANTTHPAYTHTHTHTHTHTRARMTRRERSTQQPSIQPCLAKRTSNAAQYSKRHYGTPPARSSLSTTPTPPSLRCRFIRGRRRCLGVQWMWWRSMAVRRAVWSASVRGARTACRCTFATKCWSGGRQIRMRSM